MISSRTRDELPGVRSSVLPMLLLPLLLDREPTSTSLTFSDLMTQAHVECVTAAPQ